MSAIHVPGAASKGDCDCCTLRSAPTLACALVALDLCLQDLTGLGTSTDNENLRAAPTKVLAGRMPEYERISECSNPESRSAQQARLVGACMCMEGRKEIHQPLAANWLNGCMCMRLTKESHFVARLGTCCKLQTNGMLFKPGACSRSAVGPSHSLTSDLMRPVIACQ